MSKEGKDGAKMMRRREKPSDHPKASKDMACASAAELEHKGEERGCPKMAARINLAPPKMPKTSILSH